MKKAIIVILLLIVGVVGFVFIQQELRPKLYAKVQIGADRIVVTNGNDKTWDGAEIQLGDDMDAPICSIEGAWLPGQSYTFPLDRFRTRINKQAFKPEFERVKSVTVIVPGYQLGIYR